MKKPFDLTGKVYIVTGSGKGIGKGIVRCFVKSGAKCCINCNSNAAMAEETLKEIQAIGGEDCAFVYQADVSDPEQAKAMVKATYERFGRIDGLVNNAALQKQWTLGEYPLKDYDLLMHVNLGGYINMMQAVLPYLKETKGSITCISSVHGKRPTDFDPVYAMTKGGMHMLMREAAIEFAKYGVRVNMIMPAGVKIEFKSGNPRPFPKASFELPQEFYEKYPAYPLGRIGLPDDDGWACVYLASEEAEHISGASLRADGAAMLL